MPRRFALFPGAFRPPHQAHLTAIHDLVARDDVDEVVVIVSGRARHVPGTTSVLPPAVAQAIFDVYLRGVPKVRIEIAEHTAVARALEHVAQAAPGDTVLLCLGESDREAGDSRFDAYERAAARGAHVEIVAARTGHLPVRATDLRRALAIGEPGREAFCALLPSALSDSDRLAIWDRCREGLRPIDEWAASRVRAGVAAASNLGVPSQIEPLGANTLDPAFRITLADGRRLIGKYAGDTVDDEAFDDPRRPKPRRRLQVEARALAFVASAERNGASACGVTIVVPAVVAFDKRMSTLLLTDIGSDARSLETALGQGELDSGVARALGDWLGQQHARVPPPKPFWGSADADRDHWRRTLECATAHGRSRAQPHILSKRLDDVVRASEAAASNGLRLLGFDARAIRLVTDGIAIVDFERASSCGDPAFDLATMLASYAYGGVCGQGTIEAVDEAASQLAEGYRNVVKQDDFALVARARGLAACVLLTRVASTADVDSVRRSRALASAERLSL